MDFWTAPVVPTLLVLALLLGVAEGLRRALPPLGRAPLPSAILAGTLGLALGPSAAGVLPVDVGVLEGLVYHGLALVFIAVSLEAPAADARPASGASMGFAITAMFTAQMAIGLGLVVLLGLVGDAPHPGWGLLLPMGFEEGPGQALAFGQAWQDGGMADGAQGGLIMAAVGVGWCVVFGVPLVAVGRWRGWVAPPIAAAPAPRVDRDQADLPGGIDPLTRHLGVIALCYALTFAACAGAARALAFDPGLVGAVWGVHFIVGAVIATGARVALARVGFVGDNALLGRISGVTVDGITCAALTAVALGVVRDNLLAIALITTVGGVFSLVATLAIAWRAFPAAPFEHAVLLFGMSTGTLPTGLALLRTIDPDLQGPAPRSAVVGSALSIPAMAVPMLGISNAVVAAHARGVTTAAAWGLAASLAYGAVVVGAWAASGRLRVRAADLR